MCLRWVALLGWLAVAATHPTAAPDTLVITTADNRITSSESELASSEATTAEPVPPIKMTELEVTSAVTLRYAHTAVVARVKNPAARAQEASFRVLLPETAFISGFVMTLDGKSYKAYVKEKEEAKQIYDQAVSQGLGAAHVTAKARDSNQFVVSVNVEASSCAVFNLTYEELLVRRNGVYHVGYNLHPGELVPKLQVTVHIKETEKITELRVPEVRTGNEIDATKDDAQNTKAVIVRGHDDREATITFSPDLEEQKRLMDIYAQKSKESASNTNRWYNNQNEEENDKNEGVLGQFVVQYDVDRSKDGEILVNDGYFVHFFAPTSLPPIKKYVIFVLDTSGSMMDRKIVQLREAMQTILSDLNPGDIFSIVEFASSVTIHSLKEAEQEPPRRQYYYSDYDRKPTLVAPSQATPENIDKAKVIISRLDAAGGTNINSALDVAVSLVHKRTEWGKQPDLNHTAASENGTTTERVATEPCQGDVCDPEKMKSLEPIIIFLTDGDPTVGETNPTTIINHLTEKNFGDDKATIFSLAFGEDADRKFLRKLSLRSDGFMRHIYEAADAALQLQDFYRQVSSPLLADVKFVYPGNQVKEDSLTKNKFKTFYAGSEVVVAGRVADDATEITPLVSGFCGVEDGIGKKRYEKHPQVLVPTKRQGYQPLERLWSYLTIKQLLDQKDASDEPDSDDENSPKKKALALALKYEYVTPLTSLVVVKPNATKAVDAESVDKPNTPSYTFGAPLSINSGPNYPGSAGFAYVQSAALPGSPLMAGYGLPGAPGPIGAAFGSQALSLDSFVQEESEDYDFPAQEASGNSAKLKITRRITSSRRRGTTKSKTSAGSAYPISLRSQVMSAPYPYMPNRVAASSEPRSDFAQHYPSQSLAFDDSDGHGPGLSTPYYPVPLLTLLTTTPPARTPALPARSVEPYHLEHFSWAEPLLNATADALVLHLNGTDVVLKLTKDAVGPRVASGDAACPVSVSGSGGVCVYLTRCAAARHISSDLYASTYCDVDGYAGVCCSAADVDNPAA